MKKETTSPVTSLSAAQNPILSRSNVAAKLPTPQPTPPLSSVLTSGKTGLPSGLSSTGNLVTAAEKKEKERKRKRKEEKRNRKRKTRPEVIQDEAELTKKSSKLQLPPDPGYIPKIRITTFRSLAGSSLFQSNQFKPGEEKTRTRSTRRRKDFETNKVHHILT